LINCIFLGLRNPSKHTRSTLDTYLVVKPVKRQIKVTVKTVVSVHLRGAEKIFHISKKDNIFVKMEISENSSKCSQADCLIGVLPVFVGISEAFSRRALLRQFLGLARTGVPFFFGGLIGSPSFKAFIFGSSLWRNCC